MILSITKYITGIYTFNYAISENYPFHSSINKDPLKVKMLACFLLYLVFDLFTWYKVLEVDIHLVALSLQVLQQLLFYPVLILAAVRDEHIILQFTLGDCRQKTQNNQTELVPTNTKHIKCS